MTWELGTCTVSFPVFRVKSTISHFTPRALTALERGLLMAHGALADRPEFGRMTLDRVLRDFLCLDLAEELGRPALDALQIAGVLRGKSAISLSQIRLDELQRTAKTKQALTHGELPSAPQEHEAEHRYDCVLGRIVSSRTTPHSEPASVDAAPFRGTRPEKEIEEFVRENKPPWWKTSTRIDRVRIDETKVEWRSEPGTIRVSKSGKLTVEFKDLEYTKYVADLPGEVILERIVRRPPSPLSEEHYLSEFDDVQPGSSLFFSDQLKDRVGWNRGLHVVMGSESLNVPSEAPAGSLIVLLGQDGVGGEADLVWNGMKNGAILKRSERFSPEPWVYTNGQRTLRVSLYDVKVADQEFRLSLGTETPGTPRPARTLIDRLADRFMNSDGDEWVLAAAIRLPQDVLKHKIEQLAKEPVSPEVCLSRVFEWRERLTQFADTQISVPSDALLRLARQALSKAPAQTAKSLLTFLRELSKLGANGGPGLADAIESRIASPANLTEFVHTCDLLALLKRPVKFNPSIYSEPVVRQLLDLYMTHRLRELVTGRNEFERAVLGLKDSEAPLAKLLGFNSAFLPRKPALPKRLNSSQANAIRRAATAWLDGVGALEKLSGLVGGVLLDTELGKLRNQVSELVQQVQVEGAKS